MYSQNQNAGAEKNLFNSSLPNTVYDIESKVVIVHDYRHCGILELQGSNDKAYCFFLGKDLRTQDCHPPSKLSEWIPVGTRLRTNGRLMRSGGPIPYLASFVWEQGAPLDQIVMSKIYYPPDPADVQIYHQMADNLAWQINKIPSEENSSDIVILKGDEGARNQNTLCGVKTQISYSKENECNMLSESTKVIESTKEVDEILTQIMPNPKRNEPKISKSASTTRKSNSKSRSNSRSKSRHRYRSKSRDRSKRSRGKYRSRSRGRRRYSRSRSRNSSSSSSRSRDRRRRSRHRYRSTSRERRSHSRSRSRYKYRSRSRDYRSRSRSYKSSSRRNKSRYEDRSRSRDESSRPRKGSTKSSSPEVICNEAKSKWTQKKEAEIEILSTTSSHISFKLNAGKITDRKKSQEDRSKPLVEELDFNSELNEVFVKNSGMQGTVIELISNQAGYLKVLKEFKTYLIYFHINHVWVKHETLGFCKFLEIYSREELAKMIPVGSTKVRCNARAIKSEKADYQATVVWIINDTKHCQLPPNYRSSDLKDDLMLKHHDLLYSETLLQKFNIDPLAGAFDVATEAIVHEYISLETGLLKAVGLDGGIVLFHLNQVWVEDSEKNRDELRLVPLSKIQEKDLQQGYLPIGTKVMVNVRELQASEDSELKYQATILWRCPSSNLGTMDIPKEFTNMFQSRHQRESLVSELDQHFDKFKTWSRIDLPASSPLFIPIPLAIDTLPIHWKAVVSKVVSDYFGIIKISHMNPNQKLMLKDYHYGLTGVNCFHAAFHLESVFDIDGCPAVKSSQLSMSSLLNRPVSLSARSASNKINPVEIMELQKTLEMEGYEETPVLQAVVVHVRNSQSPAIVNDTSPRPTKLRKEPANFGSSTATSFFLNLALKPRLNLELEEFIKISDKKQLPYSKTIGTILSSKDVKGDRLGISQVDSSKASCYLYGSFNPFYTISNHDKLLPNLTQMSCRVKLLHRRKPDFLKAHCGLLEISVPTGSFHTTTYAYFEQSDCKSFLTKCGDADLAQIMPVNRPDKFYLHAVLAKSTSKVPYLATSVWNEDARKTLNLPRPTFISKSKVDRRKEKYEIIEEIIEKWSNEASNEEVVSAPVAVSASKITSAVKCKYWPKCTRKECPYLHPELTKLQDLDRIEQASEFMLPVPNSAGSILSSDGIAPKVVNGNSIMYRKIKPNQHRKLAKLAVGTSRNYVVEYFNNVEGTVEKVLSDYYGVLKFEEHYMAKDEKNLKHRRVKKIRVLFTSNDVFRRNHVMVTKRKEHTVEELYEETCSAKSVGLTEVVKNGEKVKFNAVLLVMPEPNHSGINYYCTGAVSCSDVDISVPVLPIRSCKLVISRAWKTQYQLVVSSLTSSLKVVSGKESLLRQPAPKATVWSVSKLRPPHLRSWCGFGPADDDNDFVLKVPGPDDKLSILEVNLAHLEQATSKVEEDKEWKCWPSSLASLTGRVINLIDSNYGIAVGFVESCNDNPADDGQSNLGCGRVFQVLFDIYDVWITNLESTERCACASMGKSLPDVMKVGDYIKFHAVHVESFDTDPGPRELRYMATAAVTEPTMDGLVRAKFPTGIAPVIETNEISPDKIANFKAVVKVMSSRPMSKTEEVFTEELRSSRGLKSHVQRVAMTPSDGK